MTSTIAEILRFLLQTASTALGVALLGRAWMYTVRLHPFNPAFKTIAQFTDWIVLPTRRVIPQAKYIDWSSLVAAYLIAVTYLFLISMLSAGSFVPPYLLVRLFITALVKVFTWSVNLIIWLTLIQTVLSWVNPLAPIMPVLRTLSDPLLAPIRKITPNLNGIDLSTLILFVLAQIALIVLDQISFALLLI